MPLKLGCPRFFFELLIFWLKVMQPNIFQVFFAHLTCEISMNFSHLDTLFQATDGRLLFGALIDVYDNSTGEKQ